VIIGGRDYFKLWTVGTKREGKASGPAGERRTGRKRITGETKETEDEEDLGIVVI